MAADSQQPSSVYWQSSRKQPNLGSALNTLQIYRPRLICFSNSVIDKSLNTRDDCAAVARSLVFQKSKRFTATTTLTSESHHEIL